MQKLINRIRNLFNRPDPKRSPKSYLVWKQAQRHGVRLVNLKLTAFNYGDLK